jgi:hypothetical protein
MDTLVDEAAGPRLRAIAEHCTGSHRRGPTRTRIFRRRATWCTSCAASPSASTRSGRGGRGRWRRSPNRYLVVICPRLIPNSTGCRIRRPAGTAFGGGRSRAGATGCGCAGLDLFEWASRQGRP